MGFATRNTVLAQKFASENNTKKNPKVVDYLLLFLFINILFNFFFLFLNSQYILKHFNSWS